MCFLCRDLKDCAQVNVKNRARKVSFKFETDCPKQAKYEQKVKSGIFTEYGYLCPLFNQPWIEIR